MPKTNFTVLHNPKCSKSRQALAYLDSKNIPYQVVEYLKHPLSKKEILEIMGQLQSEPSTLLRTKEEAYKKLKINLNSKEEIAKAISDEPKLLERPVIIANKKAVIGRPTENIDELL